MAKNHSKGVFIFSAPSGSGKTSLARALMEKRRDIALSVSHTTRAIRPSEVHGADYYFISKHEFESMIDQDLFLEHARVYDYLYGTAKSETQRLNDQGRHVILDIDWQGAKQVRAQCDAVSIFIMPPSLNSLESRLIARGQDSTKVIQRRMQEARDQMSHSEEFDHIIINDDFAQSLAKLEAIIDTVGACLVD